MERRSFIQIVLGAFGASTIPVSATPKPTSRKLLLSTELAGFQFYDGENLFKQMQQGQTLQLIREASNHYDTNAVAVYWQDNQLGYIPRRSNIVIAQMLDRGEVMHGQIERLQVASNPWDRVKLEVYMEQ